MGSRIEHEHLVDSVPGALAELLGVPPGELYRHVDEDEPERPPADLVARWGNRTFIIEAKSSADAGAVALAVNQIQRYASALGEDSIPVVVVPYMTALGRRLCEEAGVGWMDLSGNGSIVGEGLRVRVEGKPNRFKRRGRPANVFAPKSSRVVRWLLMHPQEAQFQRDVARATGVDEGHLSRLVSRLEEMQYLDRTDDGAVKVRDPDLLLDAWREAYSFDQHHIVKGHIPARSPETLLQDLIGHLSKFGRKTAATGLAGAWQLTRFAGYRIVTLYTDRTFPSESLGSLGWRQGDRGANVWLVVPNDDGVFQGATEVDGVRCVHPVQVFLDLKGHPERAPEAAERLRSELLTWKRDD